MTRQRQAMRASLPYLVYLLFLFFQPIFDSSSTAATWWRTSAMIVAFVPIYFWTFAHVRSDPYLWSRERRRPGGVLGIVAMCVLGVVGIPANSAASSFLIYAAAAGGTLRPRRRALTAIALVMAVVIAAAILSRIPFPVRARAVRAGTPAGPRPRPVDREPARPRPGQRTPGDGAGRDRTPRRHRRARAHRARPARPAGSHPVDHHAEVRAGPQAGARRPGARCQRDARGGTHLARGSRRGPQCRCRLPCARAPGRARQRQAGAGGR